MLNLICPKKREEKKMDKLLKKLFIACLSTIVLLSFTNVKAVTDVNAQDLLVENNEVIYTEEFEMNIDKGGITLFPFIYRDNNEWFVNNVIGPTNCQEGYLYVKNLDTGRIIQLLSQPVDVFYENSEGLYFIYANNIFFVTYDGQNIEKIYSSNGIINNNILELRGNDLYFCEDNKIVKYNTVTEDKTTITRASNVTMLYIKSNNEIVYEENNNIHYIDGRSGARSTNRIITDEYEYNNLFVSEIDETDEISPMAATSQIDINLVNINNQYPAGSYFSNSGSKCTHHGNCDYNGNCGCKAYLQTIQCVAYAKWASNQYAHMSYWENRILEGNDDDTYFNSDSDVQVYFANCGVGAYIRLTKSGDYGFHSIFFVRQTSDGISSYECNLNGQCDISHPYRTFYQFRKFSPGSSYYTSHHYSTNNSSYAQYDSSYHKQYCTNSSCNGYRLEGHYSPTPGSHAVCVQCGYVGNITYSYPIGD